MKHAAGRDLLRRDMRARRRALSEETRAQATSSFASVVSRARLLRPGMRVAAYLRHGSEADPLAIVKLARRRGCSIYLPVIANYRRAQMEFVRYDEGRKLRTNRFGILEPVRVAHTRIAVRQLDLVFLPLLAIDDEGSRLGSGLGFYDRRLQHLRAGRQWRRPVLIGVAYEFQRVAHLMPEHWDVPLDGIVTESSYYPLNGSRGKARDAQS